MKQRGYFEEFLNSFETGFRRGAEIRRKENKMLGGGDHDNWRHEKNWRMDDEDEDDERFFLGRGDHDNWRHEQNWGMDNEDEDDEDERPHFLGQHGHG